MRYNISQVNKNTVKDAPQVDPPISFSIPGDDSEMPKYIVAVTDKNIIKLGYCCENKGHIYPIFLKMNGTYNTPIYIGKDGMYEMQPETFKDVNDSESEKSTSNVIIEEVIVPAGIDFTLDYVTSIV
jgi:hypothetical protein